MSSFLHWIIQVILIIFLNKLKYLRCNSLTSYFVFSMLKVHSCGTKDSGLPRWLRGKECSCQCRRHRRGRFHPWVGMVPGGGNVNPLQYSCWENSMDRGAHRATVHGVTKSQTRLSTDTVRTTPHFLPHLRSILFSCHFAEYKAKSKNSCNQCTEELELKSLKIPASLLIGC